MNLPNFISNEKNALKREWKSAIMPIVVFAIILSLAFIGSEDSLAQSRITFNVPETPIEYKIPWRTERLEFRGSAFQNEVINYLFAISGDKNFVYTVIAENGTLDPTRRSNVIGVNGYWDHGLCQLNMQWHRPFITSQAFKDWRKQAHYCLGVYRKRPTAFYGYNRRFVALRSLK